MTPITGNPTGTPRLCSRRNRRVGARAGLLALAVQLFVILAPVLPAAANTGPTTENPLVCVVYKTGTQQVPAGQQKTPVGQHTGHNTCSVCIVSASGAGATPASSADLLAPMFTHATGLPIPAQAPHIATLTPRPPSRAPPVSA